jgi:UDP-GlcNAc:undecaprenyl-phosphate GlcNAc-1-phosphate transferase
MLLLTFGLSLGFSLAFVQLIRYLSLQFGRVVAPRADRWHSKPTPTLGGVGIFLAFAASLLVSLLATGLWQEIRWGILAGSAVMFLLGVYDDFKRMTPPAKLIGQILAAALVVLFGYSTRFFTPRLGNSTLADILNILLTFFWLIGITNATNFLDNMDGLAAGISAITALFLSFFFWRLDNSGLLTLSLALSGSILGFLVFNFYPAKIFMGDSGSLFIGFSLAALAIARQPQASNVLAVMGVPILLFLLPILDTTLVTITRLLRGQSPAQGGRDHTSHRLIAFGLTEKKAVLVLYLVGIISGIMAATLESIAYWYSLVLAPLLVLSLALLTAYLGGLKVVVTPGQASGSGLTRFMAELTFRRRILEIILDFFLIAIAYYLAFFTHYGFTLNAAALEIYRQSLPVAWVGAFLSYYAFGVYRGVWRYLGVDDLMRFLTATVGAVVITAVGVLIQFSEEGYSSVVSLLFAIYLFLALMASRSSFLILDRLSGQQMKSTSQRVLVYGEGDAGETVLRWILTNTQLGYQPVGIIADNPYLVGRQIHGVEVLGSLDQIHAILARKKVQGIIITADLLTDSNRLPKLQEACRVNNCWLRSLRLEFELVNPE